MCSACIWWILSQIMSPTVPMYSQLATVSDTKYYKCMLQPSTKGTGSLGSMPSLQITSISNTYACSNLQPKVQEVCYLSRSAASMFDCPTTVWKQTNFHCTYCMYLSLPTVPVFGQDESLILQPIQGPHAYTNADSQHALKPHSIYTPWTFQDKLFNLCWE